MAISHGGISLGEIDAMTIGELQEWLEAAKEYVKRTTPKATKP